MCGKSTPPTFVIYLASVHLLSNRFDAPELIDRFNVGPLLNAPAETMTQRLLLRYEPLNLDVLRFTSF